MALFHQSFNPLFQILEAISNIDFENRIQDPWMNNTGRYRTQDAETQNPVMERLIHNIDDLKEIIKQKDESNGIKMLASIIDEIFNPNQRFIFLKEMNKLKKQEKPKSNNSFTEGNLVSRSCEPFNSIIQDDVLDSLIIKEDLSVKLPIESHYNESEAYLIQKGVNYCKMLLKKFNETRDSSMMRELKSKEVLNVIFTEQIGTEKSYFHMLVDAYPRSLEEIKFILRQQQDLVLESSIFANLAFKNVKQLYELLLELANIIDKGILGRACHQSQANGLNVASILQKSLTPEMKVYAEKISKFLNRYNQGVGF